MDSIQNIYTNNMVKEQVTTWAARMPAYCYTELCPDPTLRRTGGFKKNNDKNLETQRKNKDDKCSD